MYLVIAKKFSNLGRGGHTISKRFCELFPADLRYKETSKATNLEELNNYYDKLILRTQVPTCYSSPVNPVRLMRLNHLAYVRESYNFPTINSCTNGFYYYKYSNIKNYIPMITDFPTIVKKPKEYCIGFYSRKWLTPDSFRWFVSKLKEWPELNVCILGTPNDEIEQNTKGRFTHTYSNVEFFNKITHYVMPKSIAYKDPFPHTLLEAVQTGKQIIIPSLGHRNFKDGIDDIQDFIAWHEDYRPQIKYDNSKCFLKFENFKQFYRNIIDNGFEYSFDKRKYHSMVEWMMEEVI